MKKQIALLLSGLLLLSGCSSMLERSYSSSASHMEYAVTEDSSSLRAETYQGLVSSIMYFVNEHSSQGSIRLYNYTGDVESDLANACDEVRQADPLGAFAVRTLTYEYTRILTYYEVDIRISYRRSAQAVADIQSVSGLSGLRHELSQTVAGLRGKTVVRASYFSGDAQLIEELFWLAYYGNPLSSQPPAITVALYPETGTQRIIEVNADWHTTSAEQTEYALLLAEAASQLMDGAPPAGDGYTLDQLAGLLRGTAVPDPGGASTALAALTGEPADAAGLMLAMEFLCQEAGIDVTAAIGACGDDPALWLITAVDGGYRHLLPEALSAPGPGLTLYTDAELAELGYTWTDGLYPACSGGDTEAP